jgi:hypothetical protein
VKTMDIVINEECVAVIYVSISERMDINEFRLHCMVKFKG